jgi:hypothetical protein
MDYSPLTEEEYARLKTNIRTNVETDLIEFIQNLPDTQRVRIANALVKESFSPDLTHKVIARKLKTSPASIRRIRYAEKHGIPEVKDALANGLCVCAACKIAHLPKNEQSAALAKALQNPRGHKTKRPKNSPPKGNRRNYKKEWQTQFPDVYAKVHAKSIYPENAKIPQGNTPDEKFVRNAITELHKNEAGIPAYSKTQLDLLIYPYTQGIQTYIINRDKRPRPEGELDKRFWDWARHAAARMLSLQHFYNYRYLQRKKTETDILFEKIEKKPASTFDKWFHELWQVSVPIVKNFPLSDLEKLKTRWIETIDKYFQTRAYRSHGRSTAPMATINGDKAS